MAQLFWSIFNYLISIQWNTKHITFNRPKASVRTQQRLPTISKYRFSIPPPPTWNVAHSIRGPEPDTSSYYQDPLGLNELPIVAFSSHFESTSGTMSHNEGRSQTGCARLRRRSSIYKAKGMNKDGLLLLLELTVTKDGKVGVRCICVVSAWCFSLLTFFYSVKHTLGYLFTFPK